MPPERDHVRVNDQGVWYKEFRVARIADGVGRRCDGWRVAVKSIEDAVTRIVADSEIEGWDR